jgi:hypothetical protein
MGHKREDLTRYPVLFRPIGAYLSSTGPNAARSK